MNTPSQEDRILEVAIRLFSELGFDHTSLGMIADALGMSVADLTARTGGKVELYRAVMEWAHRTESAMFATAMVDLDPGLEGLTRLADAYLDFNADHREIMWLWLHRWMGDASGIPGLEERYVQPLVSLTVEAVREAVSPDIDIDIEYMICTIVWSVYGFLSGGMLYLHPRYHGRDRDPTALQDFRAHLHQLIRLTVA